MNSAAITEAKSAMAAGDYAAALARFGEVDLTQLDAMGAVRVLAHMGRSADVLGQLEASAGYCRAALDRLQDAGLLSPPLLNSDTAKLASHLAVGARDASSAFKYLAQIFGPPLACATSFKISPVADLPSWCTANNVAVTELDAGGDVSISGGGQDVRYTCAPTWHATISDAQIVAGWDFPFAPTGEVLRGANYMPLDKAFPFMPHVYSAIVPMVAHVWPETVTRLDVDALFLSTPERHHYGHWLSEFLPRLRAWNSHEAPRRKLAISAALPRKHRDLLTRFGVHPEDLIECELGARYAFRSLRVVHTGKAIAPNPNDVKFLSDAMRPAASSISREIIFLEREAGTRRPSNVDELNALFQELGVEKVNPARLSMTEQEELFKNARVIIGAFGTELFCLYNLPPGAAVIELSISTRPSDATVYGPVCALIGLEYHVIQCSKASQRGAAAYKRDGDIIVDCAALRARLAALSPRKYVSDQ